MTSPTHTGPGHGLGMGPVGEAWASCGLGVLQAAGPEAYMIEKASEYAEGMFVVQGKSLATYNQPIDLASIEPEFNFNPYPFYDRIRSEAPVRQAILFGLPFWYVTGYEEARELLGWLP